MNVRLSISRKDKETGEYEDEFSGFCMFIGHAKAKAEKLKERDRIKLGDVDVTRRYDKEKQKEYYTFKVFDFEFADDAGRGNQSAPAAATVDSNPTEFTPVEIGDQLPF